MTTAEIAELENIALRLPDDQRRDLATKLWDSLEPALPEWQKRLLDERLEGDTEAGLPWSEVEQRVWPDLA
jgi:hypothetical protein